jgi:hypothetical protein
MAGLVPAIHAHGPKESRWASCKGGQLRRYVGVDRRGGECRQSVATKQPTSRFNNSHNLLICAHGQKLGAECLRPARIL